MFVFFKNCVFAESGHDYIDDVTAIISSEDGLIFVVSDARSFMLPKDVEFKVN